MTAEESERLLAAVNAHLLTEPDDLVLTDADDGSLLITGRSQQWSAHRVPQPGPVMLYLLTPLPVMIDHHATSLLAVCAGGETVNLRSEADLARLLVGAGPDLPVATAEAVETYLLGKRSNVSQQGRARGSSRS